MDNYINVTGLVGIRVIDRHCRIVCRFHSEIKISLKSRVVVRGRQKGLICGIERGGTINTKRVLHILRVQGVSSTAFDGRDSFDITFATEGVNMKGSIQVVKGRIEEAAGALAGNDKLRAKGQTDQSVGHIKQVAQKGVRQVEKAVGKILDKAAK